MNAVVQTLIAALLLCCVFTCSEPVKKEPIKKPDAKFEILEKKDVSVANEKRVVVKVLLPVSTLPPKSDMIKVSRYLFQSQKKKSDQLTIFFYLPEMDYKWAAYGIAEYNKVGFVSIKTEKSSLMDTKWE